MTGTRPIRVVRRDPPLFPAPLEGREFVGALARLRLARRNPDGTLKLSVAEMKSRCGDQWRYLAEMKLTLSADGRTLKGCWLDEPHDCESCQPRGKTFWAPIRFTRTAASPRSPWVPPCYRLRHKVYWLLSL